MTEHSNRKEQKKLRKLLIEDVLDRHQRTWPEDLVSRARMRDILDGHLNDLIEEIDGPGRIGLGFGLDPSEPKISHPMLAVPNLAGREARQQIAYRLHEIITSKK